MRPSPTPLARLAGAVKRYGATTALHGIDLGLHAGEVVALLGPNGAGKSSAIGLLTGRLRADGGSVSVGGADPRDWRVRRQLGVMLQDTSLPETLTVAELVRLFAGYYPHPRPLDEVLGMAGLSDIAGRRYGALSGGQQRRVQFAIAIAGRAPLLLIDEPTTGLDVGARRALWQTVRTLRAEGAAVLLTTHYLEEADALADRIVLLDRGRIQREGTPDEIKASAAGSRVVLRSSLEPDVLAALAGTPALAQDDGRVAFMTREPEALLRRLLPRDPQLTGLEVRPLSLEDAVLLHTTTATDAAKEAA